MAYITIILDKFPPKPHFWGVNDENWSFLRKIQFYKGTSLQNVILEDFWQKWSQYTLTLPLKIVLHTFTNPNEFDIYKGPTKKRQGSD